MNVLEVALARQGKVRCLSVSGSLSHPEQSQPGIWSQCTREPGKSLEPCTPDPQELCWYDLRDAQFQRLSLEGCWAIVVNVKGAGPLAWLLRGRHWLGLRRLAGHW